MAKKLSFCRSDLTPRQELQSIAHELYDLRNHLWELVSLDTGLRGSSELYTAFSSICSASDSVSHLRGRASDCTCQSLADTWHADIPFN